MDILRTIGSNVIPFFTTLGSSVAPTMRTIGSVVAKKVCKIVQEAIDNPQQAANDVV